MDEAGGDGNDYNGISSRLVGCGGSEEPVEHSGVIGTGSVWRMNTGAGSEEWCRGLLCLVE